MITDDRARPLAGVTATPDTVAVIGAGLIGSAWAHVFARAGWQVQMWDPSAAQREAALSRVEQSLHDGAAHGLVDDAQAATRRVRVVNSIEAAVAGAGYVQESGPEHLDTKIAVFAQLDALAAPATCWPRRPRRWWPRASPSSCPAAPAAWWRTR